jgi:hypothetical protein
VVRYTPAVIPSALAVIPSALAVIPSALAVILSAAKDLDAFQGASLRGQPG